MIFKRNNFFFSLHEYRVRQLLVELVRNNELNILDNFLEYLLMDSLLALMGHTTGLMFNLRLSSVSIEFLVCGFSPGI